jgi:hypothetical protein
MENKKSARIALILMLVIMAAVILSTCVWIVEFNKGTEYVPPVAGTRENIPPSRTITAQAAEPAVASATEEVAETATGTAAEVVTESATEKATEKATETATEAKTEEAETAATESEMEKLSKSGKLYILSAVNGFPVNNPVIQKMIGGNAVSIWLTNNNRFAFFCGSEYVTGTCYGGKLNLGKEQVLYRLEGHLLTITFKNAVFSCSLQSDSFPEDAKPMAESTKNFVRNLVG